MPARRKATRSSGARRPAAPARAARKSPVPRRLFAQASPLSQGGVSMFDAQDQIHAATVANFLSDEETVNRSILELERAGFEVLQATPLTINIAGSKSVYESAFKTTIVGEERPVIGYKGGRAQRYGHLLGHPRY